MFKKMAIRELKKRDKVYFNDFFHAMTDLDSDKRGFEFNITEMPVPMHGIIQNVLRSIKNKLGNIDENSNNMLKLNSNKFTIMESILFM